MSEGEDGVASIVTSVADGIGWLTINNPKHANALTREMAKSLAGAWRELDDDPSAKVLVVTGAGSRHFCAGADLEALKSPGGLIEGGEHAGLTSLACGVSKPVVAALNGAAVGLGISFVADADFVLASENATLSDPHISLGRIVSYAALKLATRLPASTAIALGLGCTKLTAKRAFELGLVNCLVATPSDIEQESRNFVEPLVNGSPTALKESLALLRKMTLPAQTGVVLSEARHRVDAMRDHPDATEGPRARIEQRAPRWEIPPSA